MEEKELEKDEISAIVSAYDRARNVQANINIATDFMNAEREKNKRYIQHKGNEHRRSR